MFVLAALLPGPARASEVIGQTGSPLGCVSDQPYTQDQLAAGPEYSPSSYGVITSWSTMTGGVAGRLTMLMVFKPDPGSGANNFIATQKDVVRSLLGTDQLHTFQGLQIPIEPSERLGLYIPGGQPAGWCVFATGFAGDTDRYTNTGEPALGASVDYPFTDSNVRLNASAVVEPDTDRDVFGDESQDRCVGTAGPFSGCPSEVALGKPKGKKRKKIIVAATVPGAGTLSAGVASDPALATAAKGKPLRPVTETVTVTTRQTVRLVLKLTKGAKKKLRRKGKLRLKVKAVYTPSGGPPSSATRKAKIKIKRPR